MKWQIYFIIGVLMMTLPLVSALDLSFLNPLTWFGSSDKPNLNTHTLYLQPTCADAKLIITEDKENLK